VVVDDGGGRLRQMSKNGKKRKRDELDNAQIKCGSHNKTNAIEHKKTTRNNSKTTLTTIIVLVSQADKTVGPACRTCLKQPSIPNQAVFSTAGTIFEQVVLPPGRTLVQNRPLAGGGRRRRAKAERGWGLERGVHIQNQPKD
jgi:hypothetical protein